MKDVIIIPSLNPDGKLVELCKKLKDNNLNDIIVVNDGSDNEYEYIFKELQKQNIIVINHEVNKGKGAAIKTAISYFKENTEVEGYITVDCDGQHKVKDILNIIDVMHKNKDALILGTRNFNLNSVPFKSKYGNKISSFYFYFNTGYNCKDTQTGLRAIPKSLENLAMITIGERYEYEMNFLTNVAINKFKIIEVDIETVYENSNKGSHFRPIVDSFRIYKDFFKFIFASIICAILDIALFSAMVNIIEKQLYYAVILSTIFARVVSGILNFLLNKHFTFTSNRKTKVQSIRYFILFICQMSISAIIVSVLSSIFKNITIVKIIVDTILFIISYFVQKRYIFNNKIKNKF